MNGSNAFVLVFFGGIFLVGGLLFADVIFATEVEEFENYDIISLKDTTSVNGRFSLGSGIIKEEPSFIYYQVVGDGYQLKSVPAYRTIIIEDENNKPYIKVILSVYYYRLSGTRSVNSYMTKYEIHVPKDTIVKDYNLDSEK